MKNFSGVNLYVARHGQTTWNAKDKVCGITDVELTEKSIEQAKALAELAATKPIDIIISSPLKRARDTAKIVADRCGLSVEIDERLIEQNYGIYEGVHRKNEDFLNNKRNFAYKYPGGESQIQVAHRIYGLIDELKRKYNDKNILLICHGGVCRVLRTYFQDMTNEEFFHYSLENCKLEEYI